MSSQSSKRRKIGKGTAESSQSEQPSEDGGTASSEENARTRKKDQFVVITPSDGPERNFSLACLILLRAEVCASLSLADMNEESRTIRARAMEFSKLKPTIVATKKKAGSSGNK